MSRRTRTAVLAVSFLVALTACGVPVDDEPRLVSNSDVPFGLLTTTSTVPR